MPIDVTNLSQTELLQIVNATPLGTVIDRSRLRRQMDKAAFRVGDGKRIHLVRYAAWLARELDRPRTRPIDYVEARRRQAEKNRAGTKAAQDIFPIPEIEDYERRLATSASLRLFCETYFPRAFYRNWSDDHLKVLSKIERAVKDGGLFAFAMPRGSGKTTLARLSALWAVLIGSRPFVCLIGGSDERAKDLLLPIKKYILENPGLLADFPEAVYPLRSLENSSKRQLQQHIRGRLTHLLWGQDKLVFPTVEAEHLPQALREAGMETSPSSGSIITITSLDANMRGQQHTRMDGSTIRPSLVLLDDPQTRQSARSPTQTKYRLQLLNGDVLGLAGPGEEIAGVLTCTKIYEADLADQVLDHEKCPEWQAECTKLIYSFPANERLWQQYATIRADSLRQGHGGDEATEFYRANREAMDAGAVVAWPERFDARKELSALQHAMNLKLRDEEAFFAEYQNEPMQEQVHDDLLRPEQVMEKINGRARGEVPLAATRLTMFIDVHEKLLYWCICAWEENFTGYVVDYGTFPEQSQGYFTMYQARRTLGRAFPGMGGDGAIRAGLERLISTQLGRDFKRGDGLTRIDRLLVDIGYKPGLVADAKHKVGGAVMMLSKGVGIKSGRKPMSTYARKPGEVHGHFWYVPNVGRTAEFPHVAVDVNYWKSFVHSGFATAAGDPGSLSIFGRKGRDHELLAEHVAHSETWVETQGHGRVVHEWSLRPSKPDNHWFDCLVGCAAAASMCGVRAPGMEEKPARQRKRYTQDDLRRR